MRALLAVLAFSSLLARALHATAAPALPEVFSYRGPCDASAAVALDAEHFVVGNDEDNVLRSYRRGQAHAVASLPLSRFLDVPADEEADIEGAALVGRRIYWISSHGRDSKGRKERKDRKSNGLSGRIVDAGCSRPLPISGRRIGNPMGFRGG